MYLKLPIPLITPFFLTLAHCFKDRVYLNERYSEIQNNANIIYQLNTNMCRHMEVSIKERFQVCQRIFKLLRNDATTENPYKHSLYMNYEAFNLSLIDPEYPVCQEKYVFINLNFQEKYMSLNCYGHPPITSENAENNVQHLKEISIINGVNDTLVVLKCHRETKCVLLELYNYDEWHQYSDIPNEVLNIPIPQTASIKKLRSIFFENLERVLEMWELGKAGEMLHEPAKRSSKKETIKTARVKHVLYENWKNKKVPARESDFNCNHKQHRSILLKRLITGVEIAKLCNLLLGRAEYINKCKIIINLNKNDQNLVVSRNTSLTIFEPFVTIQQLHTMKENLNEETLQLSVFNCSQYKLKGKKSRSFKIAASDESSVVLLEPTIYKEKISLVPVELIENLNWDYVLHFEDWF